MVALVGAATYYTATVIVKVLVAATGKGKRGRNRADLNYDALGQAAFGRPGQLLSGGVQIAELSLAAVAILCLLGDNLAQLSGGALDVTRGVLLASGVSYLLCVTRRVELQSLVYPSAVIAGAPPVVPAPCSVSQCCVTRADLLTHTP